MRQFISRLLVVGVGTLLTACAMLPPTPRSITISEARLTQLIASQFPFNNTMLDVLDVQVSQPRIVLDPGANRLVTSLDLAVAASGVLGLVSERSFDGGIDLSYALRYEPSDHSVRMTDVQVAGLRMDGLPSVMQRPISRLGGLLAKTLLHDYVLYRFQAKDLDAAQGWGYEPSVITVLPDGLSISLVPVGRVR